MPMVGGANLTYFFTCSVTAGTLGTTAVYVSNKKVKTEMTANGLTIEQKAFDPTFSAFIDTYAPKIATTASESGTYEDGATFNSASANSPTLLALTYGGTDEGGKRYYRAQIVRLGQEVHTASMEAGKLTSPQIKGDVVRAESAITILATMFLTSHFTGGAAVAIPVGIGDVAGWVTKQA